MTDTPSSNSRISREELHQAVWEEPMRTVARRFGVSDVALAKRCRRMAIPLPGRGLLGEEGGWKESPTDLTPQGYSWRNDRIV